MANDASSRIRELLASGERYSIQEIAEKTGCAPGTVASRLSELQNPNYAGDRGPIVLERTRLNKVTYVRQLEV